MHKYANNYLKKYFKLKNTIARKAYAKLAVFYQSIPLIDYDDITDLYFKKKEVPVALKNTLAQLKTFLRK